MKTPKRSLERLKYHYSVERELADQLRAASKSERKHLYTSLYNELFVRVPDHPQNLLKLPNPLKLAEVERQFCLLRPFLKKTTVYLEIGAGDCALAIKVAQAVSHVFALDVSDEISSGVSFPVNCDLIIADGTEIPVPPGSVDLAYSNQLMEHLHPDDAAEQLAQVFQALQRGGVYICVTPNRLCGPHDISKLFDTVPKGFHLREYNNTDLIEDFHLVGFRRFRAMFSYKGVVFPLLVSLWPILMYERLISALPRRLMRWLAYPLISVKFVAFKV